MKLKMDSSDKSQNTIFVQNLPYSCDSDKLKEIFSKWSVKRCFVVKDKGSERCKGIGYVTFAQREHVGEAVKSPLTVDGRKISIQVANKKIGNKQKKKKQQQEDTDSESEQEENEKERADKIPDVAEKKVKNKHQAERSVDISTLGFSKEASEHAVVIGGLGDCSLENVKRLIGRESRVRKIHYPIREQGGVSAVVLYKGKRDAFSAVKILNSKEWNGRVLTARLFNKKLKKPVTADTTAKKSRVIVRNLSFKCSEADLRKSFTRFGTITELSIPVDSRGKRVGFGVVQFSDPAQAAEAIQGMNAKKICGRTVAVDMMMPKSKYLLFNQGAETADIQDDDDDSDNDEEDDAEVTKKRKKKENSKDKPVAKKRRIQDESDDDDDDDVDDDDEESDDDNDIHMESEDDDDDGDESDEHGDDISGQNEDDDDGDEDDDDDDIDDDDSDSGISSKGKKPGKARPRVESNDAVEGRTVFVRNLSFDTVEDDLEELMEQFGHVNYARVVVDHNTGHSKGTAFVQFKTKAEAEACIEASNKPGEQNSNGSGLKLDGRLLNISLALPRTKIVEMRDEKKDEKNKHGDKRNLHLMREGLIRAGTQAAEGLSKSDLQKRAKVEMMARQKLKNPNIFVSATRLCVRNIPTSVDDAALRKTFLKACGNPKANITESRIMRDLERLMGRDKKGKSRGYGFINFSSHEDALAALRATNNNPDIYGKDKRLIVEFSLENRAALIAKEKRLDRAKQKRDSLGASSTNPSKNSGSRPATGRPGQKKSVVQTVAPPPGKEGKAKIKLGLPSHSGPKIRHKKRDSAVKVKSKKLNKQNKLQENGKSENKNNKKNRGSRTETRDDVDKLIEKYRNQISSAASQTQNINRWN